MAPNTTRRPASGRFVLRVEPELHRRLRRRADEDGVSLNAYCAARLAVPTPELDPPGADFLALAADALGDDLQAVIVHGSWARGEAWAGSDLDVLLVLGEGAEPTRDRYRRLDDAGPWRGHAIEPHVVAAPDPDATPSGLWCEVALDGIVVHDRNHRTARYLASVRRRIAEGRLVRRTSHGHPYWTEAA